MEETIYHKIVRGEVPCHKVYEDETVLAFLDIYPRMPGHTLIIPKTNPAEFVWDLDDDTYRNIMEVTKKLALHLREATGKKYVHSTIVGTDIPYAHVHLVPFDESSELHKPQRMDIEPDHEALAKLAEKLRFS